MQELTADKVRMRKTQKELRKQHKQLIKDKEEKEKLLADLDAKAHDVQVSMHDVSFLQCPFHVNSGIASLPRECTQLGIEA
jgi:hypothetical protein